MAQGDDDFLFDRDDYADEDTSANADPNSSHTNSTPDEPTSNTDELTPYSRSGKPMSYWDSDEADQAVKMEKSLNPTETSAQLTQRLFEENSPQAAMTLIHLSQHATNENTRMNAAKYVTERVLGKVGDGVIEEETPLEKVVKEMHVRLEHYANSPDEQ